MKNKKYNSTVEAERERRKYKLKKQLAEMLTRASGVPVFPKDLPGITALIREHLAAAANQRTWYFLRAKMLNGQSLAVHALDELNALRRFWKTEPPLRSRDGELGKIPAESLAFAARAAVFNTFPREDMHRCARAAKLIDELGV